MVQIYLLPTHGVCSVEHVLWLELRQLGLGFDLFLLLFVVGQIKIFWEEEVIMIRFSR
jgi:hypothetical protein